MISETPAHIIGVDRRKGTLEKGKDADIIMFDQALNLKCVIAMGHVVRNEFTSPLNAQI